MSKVSGSVDADFVVYANSIATVDDGRSGPFSGDKAGYLGLVSNGVVAARNGTIVAVGPKAEVEPRLTLLDGARVVDAAQGCVIPGLVDPHTHVVFSGDRADEYSRRQSGATYAEILAAGGGILDTVRRTRAASEDDLFASASARVSRMLASGTTAVEIKSGYGLDVDTELRMLATVKRLGVAHPLRVVPTLLGAHAIPPEYRTNRAGYVQLVCEEMIPLAAEHGLARFCDVFCEQGAFTLDEAKRILETGVRYGLRPKLHADQLSSTGGAELAASLTAVSADHLDFADAAGLRSMAERAVVAVLLPGASLVLRHKEHANARRMIEAGVPVALATDCNPGSCPIESMPIITSLACALLGMTPSEAIVAATRNAAYAVGLGGEVGSLAVGKRADLLVLDAPAPHHVPYRFGVDLVRQVVVNGRVVVNKERFSA